MEHKTNFTEKRISGLKSHLHYFIEARVVEEALYLFSCLNL